MSPFDLFAWALGAIFLVVGGTFLVVLILTILGWYIFTSTHDRIQRIIRWRQPTQRNQNP